VLEQGDKIYVYPANMEPTAGQWVQVLRKPAGDDQPWQETIRLE
jgi:hypothetical protein